MLKLTKRTEYGLIALLHLAERDGQVVSAREIGERYPIPPRLLAESLKVLGRAGLVDSQRGANGGYQLARPAEQITIDLVVAALEGVPALTSCNDLGASGQDGQCGVEPVCPIRSPLQILRESIWTLLQTTTLRSLADSSKRTAGMFALSLGQSNSAPPTVISTKQ